MIDNEQLLSLLGISEIEIERVVIENPKTIRIYIKSLHDGAHCHGCDKAIDCFHGYGPEIELRHLPILGYKVYLVIRPKRYRCDICEGRLTTSQVLDWYTPKSAMTTAYEQDVMRALINSTLQDVSLKYDLGTAAIQGVVDRLIETKMDWTPITALTVIGIDEIALKKGHRDFVAIVSAYIDGELRVIGILAERTKAAVRDFFLSIPKRLRRTVKMVCSDLYVGFISAAKSVFGPHVAICADRFHVAKLYRQGVDDLRKKEMKRLRQALSKEAYDSLKNAHWIVRKSRHELTSDERRILNRLFQHSPRIREAYELCEALTAIYESQLSKGQGKRKIRGWMQQVANSQLTCFNRFLKTLNNHWEEITNYFIDRRTSGFVEGLNNKIKVIKRRCYGITNRDHLFQRVYLDLNGYARFA
jgi:transposase